MGLKDTRFNPARPQHSKRFCLTGTGSTRTEGGLQRSNRQGGRKSRGISEFLVTKLTENLQVGRVCISTLGHFICFHIFFLYHGPLLAVLDFWKSTLWVNLGLVAENRAYLHLALHGFKTFQCSRLGQALQSLKLSVQAGEDDEGRWNSHLIALKFSFLLTSTF